jgi:hypothetical protein
MDICMHGVKKYSIDITRYKPNQSCMSRGQLIRKEAHLHVKPVTIHPFALAKSFQYPVIQIPVIGLKKCYLTH